MPIFFYTIFEIFSNLVNVSHLLLNFFSICFISSGLNLNIIAEEFHFALGISPEWTVSSLNMAPSSGLNGIKDTDNLEVENEDEKAPQNKKKRKIEMDGSDTDLEEGEVSLHDTDTEPEDNPGEIVLPQGEMCAAEIRRAKNIEEREKLWSEQEDHYLSMFNDI